MKKTYYLLVPLLGGIVFAENKIKKTMRRKRIEGNIIAKIKRKEEEVKNILILGDSVAKGYGSTKGGIDVYLKDLLDKEGEEVDIINRGINGLTSDELVLNLSNQTNIDLIRNADVIFLNIGGNDLLRVFRKGGTKGVLTQFHKLKRNFSKNVDVILDTIYKLNEDAIIVSGELYSLLERKYNYFGLTDTLFHSWNDTWSSREVILVKSKKLLKDEKYWYDMVHPNDVGYKKYAHLILENLEELISKTKLSPQ